MAAQREEANGLWTMVYSFLLPPGCVLNYVHVCGSPEIACPSSVQIPLTPGESHIMVQQALRRHPNRRSRSGYGWLGNTGLSVSCLQCGSESRVGSKCVERGLVRGGPKRGPLKYRTQDMGSSYLSLTVILQLGLGYILFINY